MIATRDSERNIIENLSASIHRASIIDRNDSWISWSLSQFWANCNISYQPLNVLLFTFNKFSKLIPLSSRILEWIRLNTHLWRAGDACRDWAQTWRHCRRRNFRWTRCDVAVAWLKNEWQAGVWSQGAWRVFQALVLVTVDDCIACTLTHYGSLAVCDVIEKSEVSVALGHRWVACRRRLRIWRSWRWHRIVLDDWVRNQVVEGLGWLERFAQELFYLALLLLYNVIASWVRKLCSDLQGDDIRILEQFPGSSTDLQNLRRNVDPNAL